jgi:hypothetical protein
MIKKVLKSLFVGGVVLGVAFSANAADYEVNMYGASAQHKFWLNLAPDFLSSASGGDCAAVTQCDVDSKNGVAVGTGCAFNGGNDTITIRYSSKASTDGILAINDTDHNRAMAAPGCAGTEMVEVNMGASDVAYDRFDGQTRGWEDGHLSYTAVPVPPYVRGPFPNTMPDQVFNPIVVPFAFFANNSVCKFRCTRPELVTAPPVYTAEDYDAMGVHKAYGKDMWECDPTLSTAEGYNEQCIGYFKCIDATDNGVADATCNGGVNAGQPCTKTSDCPDVALEQTRCEAMPLDNINHTMAGQIFSGQVSDWSDFGPYFCPGPIHKMMRHEGSGTHATLRDLLQPYSPISLSNLFNNRLAGFANPTAIHFTSSSDLARAVADFPGAVGYFDADKSIGSRYTDGGSDGAWGFAANDWDAADGVVGLHIMKYNGVEPVRQKIVNGEYEFWAAQNVYYNDAQWTDTVGLPARSALLSRLITFSSDPANLTEAELGAAAEFWAAQDEMQVEKAPMVKNSKDRIDRK